MMFALFNQVEEWKSARKKSVLENKNGVTGAKANIQKGNDKKKNKKFSLDCKPNNIHDN